MREGCMVKVCGWTDPDALAEAASDLDFAGIVTWPASPRAVTNDGRLAALACAAREGGARPVLVVVDLSVAEILRLCAVSACQIVQLHGTESLSVIEGLTSEGVGVWRALREDDPGLVERASAARALGATLLLDGVGPAPGGNGVPASRPLARALSDTGPLVLAGGLGPENVQGAIT